MVDSAAIVHDGGDIITNIETSNGKERIETTMQVDYTFGLGLKGYTWDEANGGESRRHRDRNRVQLGQDRIRHQAHRWRSRNR